MNRRMRDQPGKYRSLCWWRENREMQRRNSRRNVRAFLSNDADALALFRIGIRHGAMMLSRTAAASWQVRLHNIRCKQRRHQREAEEQQQRDGERASHVDSVSEDRIAIYNRKTTQGFHFYFLAGKQGYFGVGLNRLVLRVACIAILHQNGGEANKVIADLFCSSSLKRNPQRFTLPCRRSTCWFWMIFRIPRAKLLGQHGLARSYLRHHGIELAIRGSEGRNKPRNRGTILRLKPQDRNQVA